MRKRVYFSLSFLLIGLLAVSVCFANWQLVFKSGAVADITEYKIDGDFIYVTNNVGAKFKFPVSEIDTDKTDAVNPRPIFKAVKIPEPARDVPPVVDREPQPKPDVKSVKPPDGSDVPPQPIPSNAKKSVRVRNRKEMEEAVKARYRHAKYSYPLLGGIEIKEAGTILVVFREGLYGGVHHIKDEHSHIPTEIRNEIQNGQIVKVDAPMGQTILVNKGDPAVPKPLQPGEVLLITRMRFFDDAISIYGRTINPHTVDRGLGAFKHESVEHMGYELKFRFDKSELASGDPETIFSAIEKFVKPFSSMKEAADFGNTASGVFVKEVKAGMTFAQVESRLGLPEKRFTLGDKVVYKYKDIAVEFIGGRVSDIKY